MPSRRTVIAAAGTLVGAGCIGTPDAPRPNDDPPVDSPERSPTDYDHTGEPPGTDGCTGGYTVSAERFDPASNLTIRLDDAARSLVATAVETGAAEVELYADSPPVDDGVYVERDGAYYETSVKQVDSTEVPAVVTNVEWEKGQAAPDDATAVGFDDLPAVDRAALRYAVYGEPLNRENEGHPKEGFSRREMPVPYPGGTDGSTLVGDAETWVRWNDRTYHVWTGGETSQTRNRFRIEVADRGDATAFREHVADEYLVDLSGLSDAEREILRTATGGTHEECGQASDALEALLNRLPDDRRLPEPANDGWYVSYEDSRYLLNVYRWVH